MPAQYEQQPAADETRPRRRLGMWIVVILAAVLLAVAVVAGLTQRSSRSSSAPAPPSASAPAPPSLPHGDVRIGASATGDDVWGVPVGYRPTRRGGVAAAVNWANYHTHESQLVEDQRRAVTDAIEAPTYQGPRVTAQQATQLRRQEGLNDAGQVVTSTGQVDVTSHPIAHCAARAGAYRVQQATAQHARVQVWMPCAFGISHAGNTAGVQLVWMQATSEVTHADNQWRLSAFTPQPAAQPAQPQRPTVSLAERARLLDRGAGWVVPANATETMRLEHA